jgi:ABC-2 type transport system ATP-binding protein
MINAKGLTMHYGPVVALNNVSFEVQKGEIVGLLGPNGAGKSTTMKILTTYLHPTSGTAMVGGFDVLENPLEVRRIIGYLPEMLPLYMDMEVRSYLNFVGNARGIESRALNHRVDKVLEVCGLERMARKVIRELTKGFKQRTALAQALIHDPDVIILDEPTSGLDPHQILEIRHLIGHLAKDKTVILSTHILQEIQATANRIVIINQGSVVSDGTVDELREEAKKKTNTGERTVVTLKANKEEASRMLSAIEGVRKVEVENDQDGLVSFLMHTRSGGEIWPEVNKLARTKKWDVKELTGRPLTLEETFLLLTEKQAQGAN